MTALVIDAIGLRVAAVIYNDARRVYGGPGHQRPGRDGDPLVTHCSGCGANADDVGVDPWSELCDFCEGGTR